LCYTAHAANFKRDKAKIREKEREQMRYQTHGTATRTIVGRDGLDLELRAFVAKQGLASAHQGTQIRLHGGLSVDPRVLVGFVVHGYTTLTTAEAFAKSVWRRGFCQECLGPM